MNEERTKKWDKRFLQLAYMVSQWSKDPSTKCGAVITSRSHRLVSVGFNGFPQGIKDDKGWLEDREIKYKVILHCEENAILTASGRDLRGCTIYTTGLPCAHCASIIIQTGMARSVSYERPKLESRKTWIQSMDLARISFAQAGVLCVRYTQEDVFGDEGYGD